MKKSKRSHYLNALLASFFLFSAPLPLFSADTARPLAILAVKTTPPAEILAALEKCETDRLAIAAADSGIAVANDSLKAATADKAKASAAAASDYAAFLQLWSQFYGPTPPPPTPAPPPEPPPTPPPVPPTPPVPAKPTLLLITATGGWCTACTQFASDVLPTLQSQMGDTLKVVDYADDAAKKAYPESVLVPRFALTRPDGTVEKSIGYMTLQQIKDWIATPKTK